MLLPPAGSCTGVLVLACVPPHASCHLRNPKSARRPCLGTDVPLWRRRLCGKACAAMLPRALSPDVMIVTWLCTRRCLSMTARQVSSSSSSRMMSGRPTRSRTQARRRRTARPPRSRARRRLATLATRSTPRHPCRPWWVELRGACLRHAPRPHSRCMAGGCTAPHCLCACCRSHAHAGGACMHACRHAFMRPSMQTMVSSRHPAKTPCQSM